MSFNAKCLLDTMPVKVFKDTEALINTPTLDLTFIEWLCTSLSKLLIEVDQKPFCWINAAGIKAMVKTYYTECSFFTDSS